MMLLRYNRVIAAGTRRRWDRFFVTMHVSNECLIFSNSEAYSTCIWSQSKLPYTFLPKYSVLKNEMKSSDRYAPIKKVSRTKALRVLLISDFSTSTGMPNADIVLRFAKTIVSEQVYQCLSKRIQRLRKIKR